MAFYHDSDDPCKTYSPPSEKMLLSVREAARLLSISERTLFALTKAGEIPCIRLSGGGKRYRPDDLRRYVESRRQPV